MSNIGDFPGNRKDPLGAKDKPEKVVERVVVSEVITRKKPLSRKFKETFFGGDFKSASRYILADVLLPGLRNIFWDVWSEGGRRVIFPSDQAHRRRQPEYRPRTSYQTITPRTRVDTRDTRYASSTAYLPDQPPHLVRNRYELNEIVFPLREEAEQVVEMLAEIIKTYDVASVADFYDLVGLPNPNKFVDNKWGWSYLNQIEVRQVREGFIIDLPPVEPIS